MTQLLDRHGSDTSLSCLGLRYRAEGALSFRCCRMGLLKSASVRVEHCSECNLFQMHKDLSGDVSETVCRVGFLVQMRGNQK